MKIKNLFLLSWKKIGIAVIAEFIFIFLHNLASGLMGAEEAIFFILAVFVLPAYILFALIYSLIYIIRNKKAA